MLSPMPLAMSHGRRLQPDAVPHAAVENINGQAIVLHVKHKDKRDPKQWKGFKFGVPFDYSMHNFLLRYYVAEHGLDPDRTSRSASCRRRRWSPTCAPATSTASSRPTRSTSARCMRVGFIHMLTKEIWDGHPCCAFAAPRSSPTELPNTYGALLRAIIDATAYSQKAENRKEIAAAIAPTNYLNQPVTVIEQVLTGTFADGLGNVKDVPDRIDFDPFPWHSMAVWILTQMKRWGYIEGDIDYKQDRRGGLPGRMRRGDARARLRARRTRPTRTTPSWARSSTTDKPEEYVNSFAIKPS
jgi:nitrate/nitrite transport system substrate-binding protein